MKTPPLFIRRAFTMIELVFVIVIVGILSFVISSSFQRNTLIEAADQIVSYIRYTQHLAMSDDVFDPTDATYFRKRWQIRFTNDSVDNSHRIYWIISDKDKDGTITDTQEYAKNPSNSATILSGDSSHTTLRTKELDLTQTYGVTSITNNCAPTGGRIFFDALGRPYRDTVFPATSSSQNLMTAPCTIILSNGETTRTIEMIPETGYVRHY